MKVLNDILTSKNRTGFLVKNSKMILILVVTSLAVYWVTLLVAALEVHGVLGDDSILPGLLQWLVGWFVVFLVACAAAWLNYRYLYRAMGQKLMNIYLYATTQFILIAVLFEVLQWRSDHETELADANLMLAFVGGGFLFTFNLIADSISAKRENEVLLRQKADAELKLLQSQINPHFLFNTFNTIYSKALTESTGDLSSQIEQLSALLRFSIEKAGRNYISIQEELDFLSKYIYLQQARWPIEVRERIAIDIDGDDECAQITPMLLQPWVENAFKFGLEHYSPQKCNIVISIKVADGIVELFVQNSKSNIQQSTGTGKAISNVRARLASIYPGRHQLSITDTGETHTVKLSIQLYNP